MREYTALDAALGAAGIPFSVGERMDAHTTFRIGGPADRFIRADDLPALKTALRVLQETKTPYFLLGNGSNLLIPDDGLRGAVVQLAGDFRKAHISEPNTILAGAGAPLSAVCSLARDNALTGLEFAWGIPGTLGGAVYMNAGAYGGEMTGVVSRVFVLDENGEVVTLSGAALGFGYRKSTFMENGAVILGAEIALSSGDRAEIAAKMDDLMGRRRDKQPLEYPSAGSVFKRPEGHFAGALIEQCGLKGYAVGGAAVSEKHAGFIINRGGATAADVEALVRHIQETVLRETGVTLTPEIRTVRL